MNEKKEMMADMVKNLALLLMEKNRELTMEQALSFVFNSDTYQKVCLLYTSPSPRDMRRSRMPSSA